jgi:sarcosine oxidase subunit gamma
VAECTIREIDGLRLAGVVARRGQAAAASAAIERAFGIALPLAPRIVSAGAVAFAWSGPAQWLAITDAATVAPAGDIEALLAPHLGGLASLSEQSDARVVVDVAGPRARDVLAKGIPLDLHPRAFAPGEVALSVASHIAVQLWQVDEVPTFRLLVPRGYAGSFRRWLGESAAEYGAVYG